jgi:serine phosphatase RsbU (regulator of sigma subunit)
MEKGEKLPTFYHQIDDEKRFSVWTMRHRKEVFVNNYLREYTRYIPELKVPEAGEDPESMIYMPLFSKDKVIGVMTVQSFQRNAYTKRHLDILKNLGLYIAIALENSETYAQIEAQKAEIEKTNQKITSSINYAQRIQQAILPEPKVFNAILPDSFIFFRPKDIVSGDFYWLEQTEDKIFLAAVDCTGHGIPGAFMSLIGNEILTEIVTLHHIESPEKILQMLHEKIRRSLRQAESDNRDGMDLALCVLHKIDHTVEFSGAMNPIAYIQNGEVQVIRGDKTSAGGIQREEERIFTKHIIPKIDTPTTYYIFSDGYQDQFGGGRKYGLPRMKELFTRIYMTPMDEQAEIIENEWLNWKGSENPIDDILMIGFRW